MKIPRKRPAPRGMTLMEVVIAIGVVAFAIPLILAASGSSSNSRRNAEADTNSVWLTREVQRQILAKWATPPRESNITSTLAFPTFSTSAAPLVLAYDSDGKFLAEGTAADITAPSKIPKAVYLVAVNGEAHNPPGAVVGSLSLLRIRILHPAKSSPAKRSTYRYDLISTRLGIL